MENKEKDNKSKLDEVKPIVTKSNKRNKVNVEHKAITGRLESR